MKLDNTITSVNKAIAHLLDNLDEFLTRQEADSQSSNRELESLTITLTITETNDTHTFSCVYAPINNGGEYNI